MFGRNRIKRQLDWAEKQFAKMGVANGRSTARLLMEHAMIAFGGDSSDSARAKIMREDDNLAPHLPPIFRAFVYRRMRGETTSRIIGQREFWSLPFRLNAATLDPRPETETIVEVTLKRLSDLRADYKTHPWRLLDLGAGTGCIMVALLHELPNAHGFACDIAADAAAMAKSNAIANNVGTRFFVWAGHWMDAIVTKENEMRFDAILSNPPYIPEFYKGLLPNEVAVCDPPVALWGGLAGLAEYSKIIPGIRRLLKPAGFAAFEIGADQSDAVAQIVFDSGLRLLDVAKDLSGHARCLVAGLLEVDSI